MAGIVDVESIDHSVVSGQSKESVLILNTQ